MALQARLVDQIHGLTLCKSLSLSAFWTALILACIHQCWADALALLCANAVGCCSVYCGDDLTDDCDCAARCTALRCGSCLTCVLLLQGLADNFGMINATVPTFLNIVDFAHKLVGPKPLEYISRTANKVSGRFVPTWNPYMPQVGFMIPLFHAECCF